MGSLIAGNLASLVKIYCIFYGRVWPDEGVLDDEIQLSLECVLVNMLNNWSI